MFRVDGSSWLEETELTDGEAHSFFGHAVAGEQCGVTVLPKQPRTESVKSPRPGIVLFHQVAQPMLHFVGGFVGKRHSEYLLSSHTL